MADGDREWGGSLHSSFRLLPRTGVSDHLRTFLEADGLTQTEVLERLAYDTARAGEDPGELPDPKRFRDPKHLYEVIGLLHQADDGTIHITDLGDAVRRWLDSVSEENIPVLGRHVAFALAACQLRNPTRAGQKYARDVTVFPFAFIWRAMLALDGKIASDELNRALFKVASEDQLEDAIERIRVSRSTGQVEVMGDETISGSRKNDRIIPWMSLASFGWSILTDKRGGEESGYYEIRSNCRDLIRDAASVSYEHREFDSTQDYVRYLTRHAAVPPRSTS